jgi:hypothetical protein
MDAKYRYMRMISSYLDHAKGFRLYKGAHFQEVTYAQLMAQAQTHGAPLLKKMRLTKRIVQDRKQTYQDAPVKVLVTHAPDSDYAGYAGSVACWPMPAPPERAGDMPAIADIMPKEVPSSETVPLMDSRCRFFMYRSDGARTILPWYSDARAGEALGCAVIIHAPKGYYYNNHPVVLFLDMTAFGAALLHLGPQKQPLWLSIPAGWPSVESAWAQYPMPTIGMYGHGRAKPTLLTAGPPSSNIYEAPGSVVVPMSIMPPKKTGK